jgi:hypothetical protein
MTEGSASIRALEGHHVSVLLVDGSRIEDCELVSVGRGRTETLWILTRDGDAFLRLADVDELWAVTPERLRRAC